MRYNVFVVGSAVITLLVAAGAWASPQSDAAAAGVPSAAIIPATWTPKELQFIYKRGFTTHYSCDGLRDKMKDILTRLGAGDVQIRSTGCISLAGPDVAPGVFVRMNVLQPAHEWVISHTVAAHWKKVDLLAGRDPVDAAGDCELIGQIRQDVLPLFVTRNVDYSATCEKGALLPGATHLTADVLVPAKNFSAAAR